MITLNFLILLLLIGAISILAFLLNKLYIMNNNRVTCIEIKTILGDEFLYYVSSTSLLNLNGGSAMIKVTDITVVTIVTNGEQMHRVTGHYWAPGEGRERSELELIRFNLPTSPQDVSIYMHLTKDQLISKLRLVL